jgi:ATP phosphoribosyltransferase regulatory subunit
MKNYFINDLLPEGFKVLLPTEAHKEEVISRVILDLFFNNGYKLVKTPIIEYEDNTSKNTLKYLNNNSFMLMEPETKKVLLLRSDITSQVAKLASTKLKHYCRPIRLAYSGEVIRNIKNSYQTDRQFKQIGAEILGGAANTSLIEILSITIDILLHFKIDNITIDFSLPTIFRLLEKKFFLNKKSNNIVKEAIENKDISSIKQKKLSYIIGLISLAGTIEEAKKEFKKYSFPKPINNILNDFFKLTSQIKKKFPKLSITVDITEGKSFLEYNEFGFKIYNKLNANPVAIGGDYKTNNNEHGIGITFLVNKIIGSVTLNNKKKIYVPYNMENVSKKLYGKNILIRELFPNKKPSVEAKKQKCDFILKNNGKLEKV